MKKTFFLVGIFAVIFLSLILLPGVCAVDEGDLCYVVGDVQDGKYCGNDGIWHVLIKEGETCLNNYECESSECSDGTCGSKFEPIIEQGNLIDTIWNFISGKECAPGEDDCDGEELIRTCGVTGLWENSGGTLPDYVEGHCGYTAPGPDPPDPPGPGSSSIKIIIFSPGNITYDRTSIQLRVKDPYYIAQYWRYSLNSGSKIEFDPDDNPTITARKGGNVIDVYASKHSSFSSEKKKSVSFAVIDAQAESFCGDGICNLDEDYESCPADCEKISIDPYCGDGICNGGESSFTCEEDCEPEPNYLWLWILLGVLLILIILIIVIVIILKKRKNKQGFSGTNLKQANPRKPDEKTGVKKISGFGPIVKKQEAEKPLAIKTEKKSFEVPKIKTGGETKPKIVEKIPEQKKPVQQKPGFFPKPQSLMMKQPVQMQKEPAVYKVPKQNIYPKPSQVTQKQVFNFKRQFPSASSAKPETRFRLPKPSVKKTSKSKAKSEIMRTKKNLSAKSIVSVKSPVKKSVKKKVVKKIKKLKTKSAKNKSKKKPSSGRVASRQKIVKKTTHEKIVYHPVKKSSKKKTKNSKKKKSSTK